MNCMYINSIVFLLIKKILFFSDQAPNRDDIEQISMPLIGLLGIPSNRYPKKTLLILTNYKSFIHSTFLPRLLFVLPPKKSSKKSTICYSKPHPRPPPPTEPPNHFLLLPGYQPLDAPELDLEVSGFSLPPVWDLNKWMFPKIGGKPPKWMVYNGKPY